MKIRDQEIMLPTSMVGNYPNPRWWDAYFARYWTGDKQPPDSREREALEDAVLAIAHDQEQAGLDIITDGRLHADNYGDQAFYYSTCAWVMTSRVVTWASPSTADCTLAL